MFEGRFVERGNAEYEPARAEALFNTRYPSRYPAAILEAVCDADVVAGVRLAKDRNWKVAARSGLLQGGQGWNSRQWGWGCENVLGVDVVTADGALVHADADENSDLYWTARGAGPAFFGIVTRFHLRAHRMPAAFTHTTYAFPIECFDELIHWLTLCCRSSTSVSNP
jgi:FAD/FMN-containing dehydrogenase